MLDYLIEYAKNTAEYRQWGTNAATFGAVGMTIFTFLECWGIWKQNTAIWRERLGEAASFLWFSYLGPCFVATAIYAVSISSATLVFNTGASGLLHIPILIGLVKFKKLTRYEKWLSLLFALMIPTMVYAPGARGKGILYLAISAGAVAAFAFQPWELYRAKATGVVEFRMILVYTISTVFWVIYTYSVDIEDVWALKIMSPLTLALLLLTGALWITYWRREEALRAHVK